MGIGFLAGYIIPRQFLGCAERTSRTICIETGMQNSALAVVLARSIGAPSIAGLPGAISATVHSCLGSLLAAYWRGVDNRSSKVEGGNKVKKGENFWQHIGEELTIEAVKSREGIKSRKVQTFVKEAKVQMIIRSFSSSKIVYCSITG